MLGFISRNLTHPFKASPVLKNPKTLTPLSLKSLSTRTKNGQQQQQQQQKTVSYLINSCELSPESAHTVSKTFLLKTLNRPDSVLSFLKGRGFSKTQIAYMVKRYPRLLMSDPENTLLPKIEFFLSKGMSSEELAAVLPLYPWILTRSMENCVIPNFRFWRDLFESDAHVISTMKRFPGLLYCSTEKVVVPGINSLRDEYGLSDSNVVTLLRYYPRLFITGLNKIRKPMEKARRMGFDPSRSMFVEAVVSIMQMKESTWDRKMEVFAKWGWTKEDTLGAFIRWPRCMTKSDEKINALMDLFVNKLGWEPAFIVRRSFLFTYSVEKRLAPRAFLLQILIEKGFVKAEFRDTLFFSCTEEKFLKKYVVPQPESVELLKLYRERLPLSKS